MSASITFLGAARCVTGSCYLLEIDGERTLIDCGLYQERALQKRNWDPFPIKPRSIKQVVLTHAHLDHAGLLPKLVREGFKGKIYCTSPTADIVRISLMDAAKVQEEDAKYKKRRHEKKNQKGPYPEIPLYTSADAERTLPLLEPVAFGESIPLGKQVDAVCSEAGHILGAASILVTFGKDSGKRRLLFSGDIGRWGAPIIRDPVLFEQADYVIMESTYGDREHEKQVDIPEKLANVINETHVAGGNILIPSFAIERAQDVLYYLSELRSRRLIPNILVFLDSPLAIGVTEIFRKHVNLFDEKAAQLLKQGHHPCDFSGLFMSRSVNESKAINRIRGSAIIIAGSGMCTGGRIKHHLANNIHRPESSVLFVGYQAVGTLGRLIVEGLEKVRIHGEEHEVRARIEQVRGFSGHADRNDLLRWIGGLRQAPKKVFLTHGEPDAMDHLSKLIASQLNYDVTTPEYKESFELS